MPKDFFNLSGKKISKAKALEFFLKKSEPKCMWCKCWLDQHTATIEHVNRIADGGDNFLDNLGIACSTCNNKRHNIDFVIPDNSEQLPLTNKANKKINWSLEKIFKKEKTKNTKKPSKQSNKTSLLNKASRIFIDQNKLKDSFCCIKCKCFLDQHTVVTHCSFVSRDYTRFNFTPYCHTCYGYEFGFQKTNNVNRKDLPFRNSFGVRCFTK